MDRQEKIKIKEGSDNGSENGSNEESDGEEKVGPFKYFFPMYSTFELEYFSSCIFESVAINLSSWFRKYFLINSPSSVKVTSNIDILT